MADEPYAKERTITKLSNGGVTNTVVLTPDVLIRREAEALLRAGYDSKDMQGLRLLSARR